ncbi:MAG: hypothetical protein JW751_09380 [Polyangiaceae bacterium]|nr:hypothetical protein [Polyangiaceae bacterium]
MNGSGAPGIGVHVGQQVGRRCVLGSCLDDLADDLDEQPFHLAFAPDYLPAGIDLRRWMSPVEDAGTLGTATAAALAGAIEYLVFRSTQRHADVSRLFIYYHQRLLRNRVRQDIGGSLRDGIRVLSRLGVPLEIAWPYTMDLFAVQPPEPVYRVAARHRIIDYSRVPLDAAAVRGCLAGGFPVAIGLAVWASFLDVGTNGQVPRPSSGERPEGRHALLLVGYSDQHRCFVARNTWGANWGDGGYCYLPYEYALDPNVAHTCWAIRTTADLAFDVTAHVHPGPLGNASPALGPTPAIAPALPTAASLFGSAGNAAPAGFGATPPTGVQEPPIGAVVPAAAPPVPRPSLLGSLGAVALGRKSPMDLAVELASFHSGTLVARFTGSQMAGQLVGGAFRHLAPTVRAGDHLTLSTVGSALLNAATGAAGPSTGTALGAVPVSPSAPGLGAAPVPGVDPGVLLDQDRTEVVLRTLCSPPPAVDAKRQHWDDSYDEEAAVLAGLPRTAPVRAPSPVPPPAANRLPAPPAAAVPSRHEGSETAAAGDRSPAPAAKQAARPYRGTQLVAVVPESALLAQRSPGEQMIAVWRALGGPGSELGRATRSEFPLADGVGRGMLCQDGALVWHPARGVFALAGSLFLIWSRMGAEGGPLGYPVTSEQQVTEGPWTAKLMRFEQGLLVDWMHEGAEDLPPFAILGGDVLYQAWLAAGAERGPAGVPVGVPQDAPSHGVRLLPCSAGGVVWTQARGAAVLAGEAYRSWCSALETR